MSKSFKNTCIRAATSMSETTENAPIGCRVRGRSDEKGDCDGDSDSGRRIGGLRPQRPQRLPAAPAALPLRCLCLCLWLRLWATAAAAPLPVEDREEEAPRAHLRAGTQPARGSNPGRAAR